MPKNIETIQNEIETLAGLLIQERLYQNISVYFERLRNGHINEVIDELLAQPERREELSLLLQLQAMPAAAPALYQHTLSPFESASAFFKTAAVPGKILFLSIGMAVAAIGLGINALSYLLRGEFAASLQNSCMALFCLTVAIVALKLIFEPLLILTAASLATRSIATGISYLLGGNEAEVEEEPDSQLQL